MRSQVRLFGAAIVGLSFVAAACGGDDGGGEEAAMGGTVDQGILSGIQGAGDGGGEQGPETTAAGPAPTTVEEWAQRSTEERAAINTNITEGGFGKSADGMTVTGPDGFTIDLTQCPAGWSDIEGVTDTEIKIGHTTAFSGTLADYGNIARAMQV